MLRNTFSTRARVALSCLAAGAALVACGASTSGEGSDSTAQATGDEAKETGAESVEVKNIAFGPDELTIPAGTEVQWTNRDAGVKHTVTSGRAGDKGVPGVSEGTPPKLDGLFDAPLADDGSDFAFTFEDTGTFEYFCRVHPSMTARVVVR